MQSLSLEQYKLLDEAYMFFNRHLFHNELPQCVIVLHRKRGAYGYFHAERFVEKSSVKTAKKVDQIKSIDELAMNPDDFDRSDIAILSTLAHEMCHVWQHHCAEKKAKSGYHDKVWARKMEEVGLMPSSTGSEGGKKTGQKCSHYIMQGGKFETHCLRFLKDRKIKLSSFQMVSTSSTSRNKTKYSCSCGTKIWGKPDLHVTCNECGDEFEEE